MGTPNSFSNNLLCELFVVVVVSCLCFFFSFICVLSLPFSVSRKSKSAKLDGDGGDSTERRAPNCMCSCNGGAVIGVVEDMREPVSQLVVERQTGASMMEQLVPEITTHALSYLDYPSLCRLSMTNSWMRRAANDDNAWKALYHKDFTLEQQRLTPVNGWKAYYADTRAIVNINAEFFNIIRERSLPAMSHIWLKADYVKCVHVAGAYFSGYSAVIQSWKVTFNWGREFNFQIQDLRTRVQADMAWVSLRASIQDHTFNVTNIFESHNGKWYMVHHHSSGIEGEQQNMHG